MNPYPPGADCPRCALRFEFGGDPDGTFLRLLVEGLTERQIADSLGMGLRTVVRRKAEVLAFYGVTTMLQLGIALARRSCPVAAEKMPPLPEHPPARRRPPPSRYRRERLAQ